VKPAEYFVVVTKREKRACKDCEAITLRLLSKPLPPRRWSKTALHYVTMLRGAGDGKIVTLGIWRDSLVDILRLLLMPSRRSTAVALIGSEGEPIATS